MVAGGDQIDTCVEQSLRGGRGNAVNIANVFAVGDDKIGAELAAHIGKIAA